MGLGAIDLMPVIKLRLQVIANRQKLTITGYQGGQNLLEPLPESRWLNAGAGHYFPIHQIKQDLFNGQISN